MTRIFLLSVLLTLNFTASSQTLTPWLQARNNDTLFCFTVPQSKVIAKHLQHSLSCDSIVLKTQQELSSMCQLITAKDRCLSELNTKSENLEGMLHNDQLEIELLNNSLKQNNKRIRWQRTQKLLFLVTTLVLGAGLILK